MSVAHNAFFNREETLEEKKKLMIYEKEWSVASETQKGLFYKVVKAGGIYSCDCPAFLHQSHRPRKLRHTTRWPCKHIKQQVTESDYFKTAPVPERLSWSESRGTLLLAT